MEESPQFRAERHDRNFNLLLAGVIAAGLGVYGYLHGFDLPDQIEDFKVPDARYYFNVIPPEEAQKRIEAYLQKDKDFQVSCKKRGKELKSEANVWANAILEAIEGAGALPQEELIRATLALIKKESSFDPNPEVWGLKKEFPAKLKDLRERYKDSPYVLSQIDAMEAKYGSQLVNAKSESIAESLLRQIRAEYQLDLLARVPELGDKAQSAAMKLTQKTRGAMQVNVGLAMDYFKDKCARKIPDALCADLSRENIEDKLWWIRPNIEVGVHLIDIGIRTYAPDRDFDGHIERDDLRLAFASYNAGPYSPRNAGFQNLVNVVVSDPSKKLTLDGDLIGFDAYGDPLPTMSNTEQVVLDLCQNTPYLEKVCGHPIDLRKDLLHGSEHDFYYTKTAEGIVRLYYQTTGKSSGAHVSIMPEGEVSTRSNFKGGPKSYADSALKFYDKVKF